MRAWMTRLPSAVAIGAFVSAVAVTAPAAADADPTPIPVCEEGDPTWRLCEDDPDEDEPGGEPGGRVCNWNDVEVPCSHPDYGSWIGNRPDPFIRAQASPVHSQPAAPSLDGCYAQPSPEPFASIAPPEELGPDPEGGWFTLNCFGELELPTFPPPSWAAAVWLAGPESGPDPETLARQALASIDLRAPALRLSPPASGSVLLGMPVWLAIEESAAAWGPISSGQVCEQGLCVEVTATAERIRWRTGEGEATVDCTRDQNIGWQPGMKFLAPGQACHHYYSAPSREQPGGTFDVSATITWRAQWAGGGQSGTFTGIDDACGPGSDELCQSTVGVQVDEMHVLVQQ